MHTKAMSALNRLFWFVTGLFVLLLFTQCTSKTHPTDPQTRSIYDYIRVQEQNQEWVLP